MTNAPSLRIVADCGRAASLLHPIRLRLLERLAEPDSASGLARRMRLPRQKVNYHLRELEKGGLVALVEERRKGNCVERVVRATARGLVLDPGLLGGLAADPADVTDRASSAYLVALAARTVRDLAGLREQAAASGKRLATLGLEAEIRFATAADRNAFAEELTAAVGRIAAKYHDERTPGGRRFRLVVGAHPAPRTEEP